MKKSFFFSLCLVLCLSLLGCTDTAEQTGADALDSSSQIADSQLPNDPTSEAPIQASTDAQSSNNDVTSSETSTDSAAPTQTISPHKLTALSIACSTKGYNPYLTTDILVEQSASLLFENFIDISPDFAIDYRLAQQVVSNGNLITITPRSGCYFADGSPITVIDLLASMQTACVSETYAARFANVLEVTATDTAIVLTLAQPDSLFAYLLDIPVLKADEIASATPVSSGRYLYGSIENTLAKNHFAPFPTDGPAQIKLVPVTSYDDMMSNLALGHTNYTVQGESLTTQGSSISSAEHYYKTNILLYLGVNAYSKNPLCNTTTGRTLLSSLINRDALAIDTYAARAYAARGALNSFYPIAKDTQSILSAANDTALIDSMALLGYTYNNESSFYQNEKGERANISILVQNGNPHKTTLATELTEGFTKHGIETTIITAPDFNSFLTLLESNQFELYIGEVKLYNNIELSSFWAGNTRYGISASETLLGAYYALRADATANTATMFEAAFAAEMPYIPLLWRNGVVLTSRDASGVNASISNPFYTFGDLTFSD